MGVLGELPASGVATKQMALQAFSLAIGRLPGVAIPRGPVGMVSDGTAAVGMLHSVFSQLTPAQRAAATRALSRWDAGAMLARVQGHISESRPQSALDNTLLAVRRVIEPRVAAVTVPVTIRVAPTVSGQALAETTPKYDGNGHFQSCAIVVRPDVSGRDDITFTGTVAHEFFHCVEAMLVKSRGAWDQLLKSQWVSDGACDWVGSQVVHLLAGASGEPVNTDWLEEYLATPGRSLLSRTYDGEGFFDQLDWASLDPWPRLAAIISMAGAQSGARVFATAITGAPESTFLAAWGSSFWMTPALGHDWVVKAISMPTARPPIDYLPVADGASEVVHTSGVTLASRLVGVHSAGEVTTVTVASGVVRFHDGAGRDYAQDSAGGTSRVAYCSTSNCECPPGSAVQPPRSPLEAGFALAVTAGPNGPGFAEVSAESLADFCGGSPPPPCSAAARGVIVPGERIGPVSIGMSQATVRRRLTPASGWILTSRTKFSVQGIRAEALHYATIGDPGRQLIVVFAGARRRAIYVATTSPCFVTKAGIGSGVPLAHLKSTYGVMCHESGRPTSHNDASHQTCVLGGPPYTYFGIPSSDSDPARRIGTIAVTHIFISDA
jgi:hypothetical protein